MNEREKEGRRRPAAFVDGAAEPIFFFRYDTKISEKWILKDKKKTPSDRPARAELRKKKRESHAGLVRQMAG